MPNLLNFISDIAGSFHVSVANVRKSKEMRKSTKRLNQIYREKHLKNIYMRDR